MKITYILLFLLASFFRGEVYAQHTPSQLAGAWEAEIDGNRHVWIITEDGFVSAAVFHGSTGDFVATMGGKWVEGGIQMEFHTVLPEAAGKLLELTLSDLSDRLVTITMDGQTTKFTNIDRGEPGQLAGAWLFSQRKTEEGFSEPRQPGTRKTMKILSGTRFQWIAYDTGDDAFFGTGGGTYTTKTGKYTENIEFFSRDLSRVGASLAFDFMIEDGAWHHSGFNSKGEPLYEVWRTRAALGE